MKIAAVLLLLFTTSVDAQAVVLGWTRTYSGADYGYYHGHSVAVAADGSIYVTGRTEARGGSNHVLRKYSPTGAVLWTKTYTGASYGYDYGKRVAVAADGSVYVTGYIQVAGQSYDLLLRKYSPAGAALWTTTYNGAYNGYDHGNGIAVATDGSIYVTGRTQVAVTGHNLLLRKYSPNGALLWTKTYNGVGCGWEEGWGVAVAADGGVYVTGSVRVSGQGSNLLLQKYLPTGVLLWTKTYNGTTDGWDSDDWGNGVAVAADGGIYVIGSTYAAGQRSNLLLQKYLPTGRLLWTKTYNGAANGDDNGYGIAVAADGGIYVTGKTYVAGQGSDLLLQKYLPTGALRWMKTYHGAYDGENNGSGVALAPPADGSIYVTGATRVGRRDADVLLMKYEHPSKRPNR